MELKTQLHLTRVLHVEVPAHIEPEKFEAAIWSCVEDGATVNLKNGITVDAEALNYTIADSDPVEWAKDVLDFLKAVVELETPTDEFFFHR